MEKKTVGKRVTLPRRAMPSMMTGGGGEMLILYGDGRLTVRGCRKILLYTPEEIRFRLCRRQLSVTGRNLRCTSFAGGNVTVEGEIQSLCYRQKEGSPE